MKLLLKVLLGSGLLLSTSAYSGVLIEPYLGYHMGTAKQGAAEDDLSGMVIGGRLGYSSLGFQIGADYMGGEWADDDTPKSEYTLSNLGIFVAYSFPILIRAYGTYFFDSELKDTLKLEGTAVRLGLGFSPLPLLDVNLEYMMGTYDEANGFPITDYKTNTYGIVLSMPFDL